MADPVAIISVAGTSAVGLAGVLTNFYGGAASRRWQSREERSAELRSVLDAAAEALAVSMQQLADAHEAVSVANLGAEGEMASKAASRLSSAVDGQRRVWTLWNRLRVRRGADAEISKALYEVQRAVGQLDGLIRRELGALKVSEDEYVKFWEKAHAAEKAFYDAAAAELRVNKRFRS